MKKLTLLMMVLLAFTACGSDDDDDYNPYINVEQNPSAIIGTWTSKDIFGTITQKFDTDSVYEVIYDTDNKIKYSGKYKYTIKGYTISFKRNEIQDAMIFEVTKSQFQFKINNSNSSTFKKEIYD